MNKTLILEKIYFIFFEKFVQKQIKNINIIAKLFIIYSLKKKNST